MPNSSKFKGKGSVQRTTLSNRTDQNSLTKSILVNTAGFTLMEVMFSSVILALVLGSTLGIVSHCSLFLADLRLRTRSNQILQQKVEDLRTKTWSQIGALPKTFSDPSDSNGFYRGTVNQSVYQTHNGTSIVVRATVMVNWTNRHGLSITNSLTTLISDGGINRTTL